MNFLQCDGIIVNGFFRFLFGYSKKDKLTNKIVSRVFLLVRKSASVFELVS